MRFVPARHAGYLAARALLEDDTDPEPLPLPQPDTAAEPELDIDPKEIALRYADESVAIKGHSIHGTHAQFLTNLLKGKQWRKVDRNTYAILNSPEHYNQAYSPHEARKRDGSVSIRLHDTDVVNVMPDDTLTINYGQWNTVTTRDRINNHLPAGWGVYTSKGEMMWSVRGIKIMNPKLRLELPASSGDQIMADGTLVLKDEARWITRRKPKMATDYGGYRYEPPHYA